METGSGDDWGYYGGPREDDPPDTAASATCSPDRNGAPSGAKGPQAWSSMSQRGARLSHLA